MKQEEQFDETAEDIFETSRDKLTPERTLKEETITNLRYERREMKEFVSFDYLLNVFCFNCNCFFQSLPSNSALNTLVQN